MGILGQIGHFLRNLGHFGHFLKHLGQADNFLFQAKMTFSRNCNFKKFPNKTL